MMTAVCSWMKLHDVLIISIVYFYVIRHPHEGLFTRCASRGSPWWKHRHCISQTSSFCSITSYTSYIPPWSAFIWKNWRKGCFFHPERQSLYSIAWSSSESSPHLYPSRIFGSEGSKQQFELTVYRSDSGVEWSSNRKSKSCRRRKVEQPSSGSARSFLLIESTSACRKLSRQRRIQLRITLLNLGDSLQYISIHWCSTICIQRSVFLRRS
jgi:hypothetical protein